MKRRPSANNALSRRPHYAPEPLLPPLVRSSFEHHEFERLFSIDTNLAQKRQFPQPVVHLTPRKRVVGLKQIVNRNEISADLEARFDLGQRPLYTRFGEVISTSLSTIKSKVPVGQTSGMERTETETFARDPRRTLARSAMRGMSSIETSSSHRLASRSERMPIALPGSKARRYRTFGRAASVRWNFRCSYSDVSNSQGSSDVA